MMHRPLIMGVLNVTPDSFSDGGRFTSLDAALARAKELVAQGADILDIGGESTRPGALPVGADEELARVLPVLERARALSVSLSPVRLSIDTRKSDVAEAALNAGARIVNDVSAGGDPRMAEVVAKSGAGVILMHMRGTPETMQRDPHYPRGVVTEVREFLEERARAFEKAGVPREKIWVDPGIGFGKTLEHNLELLRALGSFREIAGRVVAGTSRKSFLAKLAGDAALAFEAREAGTIASSLFALTRGASVLRVHDVANMRRALAVWEALDDRQP